MIHPQYWSLRSIHDKLFPEKRVAMSGEDAKCYLMLNPKGKTILDIGAYNGDSARLFIENGAKHVICVEMDKKRASMISKAVPNTTTFAEQFDPEKHLLLGYDAIKCDIEGYEMELLPYAKQIQCPIVIEAHNWYVLGKFAEQGFTLLTKPDPMLGLCMMGKNLEDKGGF